MILLNPLSCQKFQYNISVTKTNETQNDRAKVQIKYEKFFFIGVFFFDYSVFCCFPSMIQNKKSMAQIAAPCYNKRKPYSQNRN